MKKYLMLMLFLCMSLSLAACSQWEQFYRPLVTTVTPSNTPSVVPSVPLEVSQPAYLAHARGWFRYQASEIRRVETGYGDLVRRMERDRLHQREYEAGLQQLDAHRTQLVNQYNERAGMVDPAVFQGTELMPHIQ